MPGQSTRDGFSGSTLLAVVAGLALTYAAVKGKRPSDVLRAFMTGGNPRTTSQAEPITTPSAMSVSTGATAASDAATPGMLAHATGRRAVIVQAARSQLGKPYVWFTPISWDNPDPGSFDCSGLAGWCYNKIGVKLAHQSATQYSQLQHVPFSQAQQGDLVFYSRLGAIYHVAIYLGSGQVIEAPTPGIPVRIRTLSANESDLMNMAGVMPNG